MVRDSKATSRIIAHFCSTPECKMRQSTALHATRRNQVSAVVRQAKHYCVDRDADLQDVVADPPRLPGWERVVGDGRHLPEERPAVLDQPVSNPLAFPGSPHATLRFPKLLVAGAKPRRVLPRAGAITSRFESLERSGGVETNELPLAPRDATQTRVSALRGPIHDRRISELHDSTRFWTRFRA